MVFTCRHRDNQLQFLFHVSQRITSIQTIEFCKPEAAAVIKRRSWKKALAKGCQSQQKQSGVQGAYSSTLCTRSTSQQKQSGSCLGAICSALCKVKTESIIFMSIYWRQSWWHPAKLIFNPIHPLPAKPAKKLHSSNLQKKNDDELSGSELMRHVYFSPISK
jgi:hypothetical protein